MYYPKLESKSSFDEFGSSFFNAFELNKDDPIGGERTTSTSPLPMFAHNQNYVSDYLHCSYEHEKPPMQKSLSWSSTDPSIAFERDSYLMPYACNDYKKYALPFERPRSITLPAKSSSTHLNVEGPSSLGHHRHHRENSSKYETSSSLSTDSDSPNNSSTSTKTLNPNAIKESSHFQCIVDSDECLYISSQEDINLIIHDKNESNFSEAHHHHHNSNMHLHPLPPARQRSNTAPPNISITAEDGHLRYILESEEEGNKIYSTKTNDENNNTNKKNSQNNNQKQFNKTIQLIDNYCS